MVSFLLRAKPIMYVGFFLLFFFILDMVVIMLPSEYFINSGVDRSFRELGYWITIITVITIDPIIETFCFQYLVLKLVRKFIQRPKFNLVPYVLLSSIIFGFIHDSSGFYTAYAIIAGVILSIATYFAFYKKYGFFLVVSIHGIHNFIALVL
ncbi:CPBP family glutamic-type intramembrane protease [Marinifilum sp. RC60d5]|uniref:CPBP family glutamic-type intramembrane protease n=1 Tax=Marinifilum sp. RC60d5 TaxID=3458414 RepID=UPI0040355BA2